MHADAAFYVYFIYIQKSCNIISGLLYYTTLTSFVAWKSLGIWYIFPNYIESSGVKLPGFQ